MPKFHITDTFAIGGGKNVFVLAGRIVVGTIRVGMTAHVRIDASETLAVRIHAIEFVYAPSRPDDTIALCIDCSTGDDLKTWQSRRIESQEIDITDAPPAVTKRPWWRRWLG